VTKFQNKIEEIQNQITSDIDDIIDGFGGRDFTMREIKGENGRI
jgi:hypothetical protein